MGPLNGRGQPSSAEALPEGLPAALEEDLWQRRAGQARGGKMPVEATPPRNHGCAKPCKTTGLYNTGK